VDLSLNTHEHVSCAYYATSGALFANTTLMMGSGSLTHSASVAVTSCEYYVKCSGLSRGALSDEHLIHFAVEAAIP